MVDKILQGVKVIALCGSTRFKDVVLETLKRLTLKGYSGHGEGMGGAAPGCGAITK